MKAIDPVANSMNELDNDREWSFAAEIRHKLHGLQKFNGYKENKEEKNILVVSVRPLEDM
jgi:hypothetical protein